VLNDKSQGSVPIHFRCGGILTVKLLQTTAQYSHCCNNSKLRCHVDLDCENDKYETGVARSLKAKFHYAIWFEAGSKLVADLQRVEIRPII